MTRLDLSQGFLGINAALGIPSHTSRVMLFNIRSQRLEDVVESIDPFYVFSIPIHGFSKLSETFGQAATDFSLYSLIMRLP